ncbi:MAG: amidohydrolase family protein [Polyangiaceae bacterium]
MKKSQPDPALESPIPFRTGCNGEFAPRPETSKDRLAERTFRDRVTERARKLGISRREFVGSVLGTTTALGVINTVYGCGSESGAGGAGGTGAGGYGVGGDMMDPDEQCEVVEGHEFIFDVQTHHVNPDGAWRRNNPGLESLLTFLPQGSCDDSMDPIGCYDIDHYLREMFVNSDTSVAVLSALPGPTQANGLEPDEMAATMEMVNTLADSKRSVIHAIVHPENGMSELDGMQQLAEDHPVGAWKIYTPVGGYRLDDPAVGIPFLEKARELGVTTICAHKGLTLPGFDPLYAEPDDVGVVAPMFPDVNFVIYHSAYETDVVEGPYDPMGAGIDRFIKAMLDHGVSPGQNVYAELGTTWRQLMTKPVEAQHAIGKLLLYFGEDRVVWGTDSIWYGSPQDQIAAFRAFSISEELQETHGYPALTDEVKAKIFGLNSAALYGIDPDAKLCEIAEDDISQQKQAMRTIPALRRPSLRNMGPRTRQEWLDFLRVNDGKPG